MQRSPQRAIAWRRKVPTHPRRYLAALAGLGILHGLGVGYGGEWLPWGVWPRVLFSPLLLAAFLVPAAWIVVWRLRGRIAAARGLELAGLTLLATLGGAWLCGCLLSATGGVLLFLEGEWSRALISLSPCWIFGAFCAFWGWFYLPVALPLTWLAILLLRAAAGGATASPRQHCALVAAPAS